LFSSFSFLNIIRFSRETFLGSSILDLSTASVGKAQKNIQNIIFSIHHKNGCSFSMLSIKPFKSFTSYQVHFFMVSAICFTFFIASSTGFHASSVFKASSLINVSCKAFTSNVLASSFISNLFGIVNKSILNQFQL